MSADSLDARQKAALLKLFEELRVTQARAFELTEEIQRLLGGGTPIGALLKDSYKAFERWWTMRYHGAYVWTFTKDAPQMKRLLASFDPKELDRRMGAYLADSDPFYEKARHPFGLFVMNVNRFADITQATGPFDLKAAGLNCQHEPRCLTDSQHTQRRNAEMRG